MQKVMEIVWLVVAVLMFGVALHSLIARHHFVPGYFILSVLAILMYFARRYRRNKNV
jgi:hypothetical protein